MSRKYGITGGGREAEDRFREITGARTPEAKAEGDAVLDGHPIEIKQATGKTLNQIRAVKYMPLVVWFQPSQQWYVIPAHVVVQEVSKKVRGQHTENAFESANLNLSVFASYQVDERDLRKATLKAVKNGAASAELKEAMAEILAQSMKLAKKSRRIVEKIFAAPSQNPSRKRR